MQFESSERYFAAANTHEGFISYYDNIFGKLNKVFVIKGGPGTGKSRLMRKVGERAEAGGRRVEYFYCSFDPDSLDGIIINDSVAVVDGTAPHVYEPRLPGAMDETIDLSRFWNSDILSENKGALFELSESKSRCFELAYLYLAAIGKLYSLNERMLYSCIKWDTLRKKFTKESPRGIFLTKPVTRLRAAFGRRGLVEFPLCDNSIIEQISISDRMGTLLTSGLMGGLADELKRGGAIKTFFLSPLEKGRLDGYILSSGVAVISKDNMGDYDISEFMSGEINNVRTVLQENREIRNVLLSCAEKQLAKAAMIHSEIEKIYVSAMDFVAKEKFTEEIMEKLICS